MLHPAHLLLLLLFALVAAASIVPSRGEVFGRKATARRPDTNAERLAKGLGPNAPRRLYAATRTLGARQSTMSAVSVEVRLRITDTNGGSLGYVGVSNANRLTAANEIDQAVQGMLLYSGPGQYYEITQTKSGGPGAGSKLALDGGKIDAAHALGAGMGISDAGQPSGKEYQTTIWTASNPDGGQVGIAWVDPSGSPIPLRVFVSPNEYGSMSAARDLAQAQATQSDSYEVLLYYEQVT